MIKVLKQTPATINGRDCYETLVHDDECQVGDACNLCIYKGYKPDMELYADCAAVHGCTIDAKTYFIAEPL